MQPFLLTIQKDSGITLQSGVLPGAIQLSQLPDRVRLEIPFPCQDFLFHRQDGAALTLTNDLRLFRGQPLELDPRGIYSLLQYGTCVSPLTPFKGIGELAAGYAHVIHFRNLQVSSQLNMEWSQPTDADRAMRDAEQIRVLSETIRAQLRRVCSEREALLLFSGGVDSSVLAVEVGAMRLENTRLLHYSFGPDDPETDVAQNILRHLGMQAEIVRDQDFNPYRVLDDATDIFPFPLCDYSCLPTYNLVRYIAENYSPDHLIVDGTGADGNFGLFIRALRLTNAYRAPRFLRALAGWPYRPLGIWRRPGELERRIGLLRRSARMPLPGYTVAQHNLLGIGCHADPADAAAADNFLDDWVKAVAPRSGPSCLAPVADIGILCSKVFAQKDKTMFNHFGFTVEYPFLNHAMVDLALQHARFWPGAEREDKYTLKKMLAARVPPEVVYRQKVGFMAKTRQKFADPRFLRHLEAAMDEASPLRPWLEPKVLRQLYVAARDETPLPNPVYKYLWSVAFLHRWLSDYFKI